MPSGPMRPEPEADSESRFAGKGEEGGGGVRLGNLQLAIMRVLWRRGEASVSEVHEELEAERGLAPTTVATMLVKLERKGAVVHRSEGRRFIYRPRVDEEQVRRSMVDELTSQLFQGDVTALVNHLLAEHSIEPGELAELRSLIAARQREGVHGPEAPGGDVREASREQRREKRREEDV
jgi:BlaI family transcriptional regulator, penicillinase repressor